MYCSKNRRLFWISYTRRFGFFVRETHFLFWIFIIIFFYDSFMEQFKLLFCNKGKISAKQNVKSICFVTFWNGKRSDSKNIFVYIKAFWTFVNNSEKITSDCCSVLDNVVSWVCVREQYTRVASQVTGYTLTFDRTMSSRRHKRFPKHNQQVYNITYDVPPTCVIRKQLFYCNILCLLTM